MLSFAPRTGTDVAQMMQMDEEEIIEYKKAQLEEKERRILRERDSVQYHYEVKKWDRRKLMIYAAIGASGKSKGRLHRI